MPIVQIVLFGFAISTEVNNIRFAAIVPEHNEATAALINKIKANSYFDYIGEVANGEDARLMLKRDNANIILHFPKNYKRGNNNYEIIVDASDPNTGTLESNYMKSIINDYNSSGLNANNTFPIRFLYNPQLQSAYNFVPGIMGLILMLICAMMTSISIVREKEIGTMEVLLVSPVKPILIIITKMIPYFVISCVNLVTILLLAFFVLDLPMEGQLFWIIFLSLEYILLALAIGLLISTIMKSQLTAMLFSVMTLMLPTILLSGMIYPVDNFPKVLQYFSVIIPGRWYISGLRKFMIEGLAPQYVLNEMGVIFLMIVVIIGISLIKFKNRLE